MKQVVQNIRTGETSVRNVPDPIAAPGCLLVATAHSLLSAGTERYVVELARKSLVGKAQSRPDHVRRVLQKLRQEGLIATASQVFAKLGEPMTLGYSTAGVVLECGPGVQAFKPGDRVATAGPHAGVLAIGKNLCARVPDSVPLDQAAYAAVGAIALQGVRLGHLGLGDKVLVIGLGLVGLMAAALAKAHGCQVFGTDVDPHKLELARSMGLVHAALGTPADAVRDFSDGVGVDAALICAATDSNAPLEFAAEMCRSKGRIVLVGVAGMNLPRTPFFQKELEFVVSASLGPGRGDPLYEERGQDYPVGYARWTAQRNMQAVLGAIEAKQLPVHHLTTHRFPVEQAAQAYDLITERSAPFVGVVLDYNLQEQPRRRVQLRLNSPTVHRVGLSMVGAGNFARLVLMPALQNVSNVHWRGLCSARGLNATQMADDNDFAFACSEVEQVLADPQTDAVFIATRHNLHANLVTEALRAGKHVFVEKPLCISFAELEAVRACVEAMGPRCPILMVGFNRRFAAGTQALTRHFVNRGPLSLSYRFAPGEIPANAWPQDEAVGGGRIVGEACHAIDLCTHLAGAPPQRVYAESVGASSGGITDDRVCITLRHVNGSVSQIFYQAGGDRAGPMERIEIFGGGRTATLEGWDKLELWADNRRRRLTGGKDKGHGRELRRFVQACAAGGPSPIAWDDLYAVAWASLAAVSSLRSGMPVEANSGAEA